MPISSQVDVPEREPVIVDLDNESVLEITYRISASKKLGITTILALFEVPTSRTEISFRDSIYKMITEESSSLGLGDVEIEVSEAKLITNRAFELKYQRVLTVEECVAIQNVIRSAVIKCLNPIVPDVVPAEIAQPVQAAAPTIAQTKTVAKSLAFIDQERHAALDAGTQGGFGTAGATLVTKAVAAVSSFFKPSTPTAEKSQPATTTSLMSVSKEPVVAEAEPTSDLEEDPEPKPEVKLDLLDHFDCDRHAVQFRVDRQKSNDQFIYFTATVDLSDYGSNIDCDYNKEIVVLKQNVNTSLESKGLGTRISFMERSQSLIVNLPDENIPTTSNPPVEVKTGDFYTLTRESFNTLLLGAQGKLEALQASLAEEQRKYKTLQETPTEARTDAFAQQLQGAKDFVSSYNSAVEELKSHIAEMQEWCKLYGNTFDSNAVGIEGIENIVCTESSPTMLAFTFAQQRNLALANKDQVFKLIGKEFDLLVRSLITDAQRAANADFLAKEATEKLLALNSALTEAKSKAAQFNLTPAASATDQEAKNQAAHHSILTVEKLIAELNVAITKAIKFSYKMSRTPESKIELSGEKNRILALNAREMLEKAQAESRTIESTVAELRKQVPNIIALGATTLVANKAVVKRPSAVAFAPEEAPGLIFSSGIDAATLKKVSKKSRESDHVSRTVVLASTSVLRLG